jgi:hypothetical protein
LKTGVEEHVRYVGFDITEEKSMSALKMEGRERVRAGDADGRSLGMIDCGRASKRTKGVSLLLFLEFGSPPFNWLYLF